MGKQAQLFIWYSFLAIMAYLVLTRPSGAIGLLQTAFGGASSYVRALQGR